ncbi:MAG: hypothetical protein ACFWT6_19920 [Virgibacillus proomii]|jgi:hypothetical protein
MIVTVLAISSVSERAAIIFFSFLLIKAKKVNNVQAMKEIAIKVIPTLSLIRLLTISKHSIDMDKTILVISDK